MEGLEPWGPKDIADCAAALSSRFVAPTLRMTDWIPLLTTSCGEGATICDFAVGRRLQVSIAHGILRIR